MCEVIDAAKREGERKGRFEMLVSMVNDYIAKKKISQKAACEDLSVSYSKYMAAKRYLKKMELQGIQE